MSGTGSSPPPAPLLVAHIITRLDVGGAQETAVRMCGGLDRTRFEPVLISGPDHGSGGSVRSVAEAAGVEVLIVPSLHGRIRPWADGRAVADLTSVLRDRDVDIVHTHSSKAGVLGRLAASRARVPVVVHMVHGWSFNDSQGSVVCAGYRAIERSMARRTDALVVVAESDRERGLAHRIGDADRYHVIRSGIPLDTVTSVGREAFRQEAGWDPGEKVVVSVGRLEAQKDPHTLLTAFLQARTTVPDLRLVLVGAGSLEPEMRARLAREAPGAPVDLLGLREDVADILGASDLFALSSRWEGLPRAALEAIRAGLPVVATDTGGIAEVITDGVTGRLVPIADAGALAAAIASLIHDPEAASQMAANARASLPRFSDAAMVADLEALYEHLAARRGATP